VFKHYLLIAIRTLFKRETSSWISIAGLAIAISCCIFILLFISDELQFDRFHVKADRIYRLIISNHNTGEQAAVMAAVMFPPMMNEIPEFESGFRMTGGLTHPIKSGQKVFTGQVFYADEKILQVMSFPLERGDPAMALKDPFSAVLTDSLARKYFGEADPLGRAFTLNDGHEYKVTGILKEIPRHSHIRPEFIASLSSLNTTEPEMMNDIRNSGTYFYFLLREHASSLAAENKLKMVFERYYGKDPQGWGFVLEPLDQIYLYSADTKWDIAAHGNILYMRSFAVIAVLILFMASFNYANYLTVRVKIREKEIAVRRLLGAGFRGIMNQLIVETVLSMVIALTMAIVIVEVFMNEFNQLTGKELYLSSVMRPEILCSILGLLVATIFTSVLYPAAKAAMSDSLDRLKGSTHGSRFAPRRLHFGFRQVVTCLQFVITISLIASTVVIFYQLAYMRTTNLGFNKEHLLALTNPYGKEMYSRFENFRNLVRNNPNVQSVTAGDDVPSENLHNYTQMWVRNRKEKEGLHTAQVAVDYDYFTTLQARFTSGRNFSRDFATDAAGAVILNAEAARELNLENPVGTDLSGINNASDPQRVIGVIDDIHFRSFREKVLPTVFFLRPWSAATILLRLRGDDIPSTMKFLEAKWDAVVPDQPFAYTFLDDSYDNLYQSDRQTSRVIVVFCLFAVAISSIGLTGVMSLIARMKRKEIGVRKVLGASLADVVVVVTREYIFVIAAAAIIAWPLAYILMTRWLEGFAYRIDLTWWPFVGAGGAALLIALLTGSVQTLKAGMANPIESLRTE
jgi:putative ABC transport system permease protein